MAIVREVKIGGLTVRVETDPAGYSEGTYGYIVSNVDNDVWFDGGYPSADDALRAGRILARRVES